MTKERRRNLSATAYCVSTLLLGTKTEDLHAEVQLSRSNGEMMNGEIRTL